MSPLRRLWNVVRRSRMDDDLRQELDTHVALIEEEERRQGLTAEQARRNARTRFGNPDAYREMALDAVIATWFEHAWRDLRYAVRTLRKSPGLVAVVVLCLGLGIGVNTTIFSLFNAALLTPPTGRDPDRLVQIEPGNSDQISYPNYTDLGRPAGFEDLALSGRVTLNLRSGDSLRSLTGLQVSANYFELLGVSAWRGRTFSATEESPQQRPRVVVLDFGFSRRHFPDAGDVVGRILNLNGDAFTVVGVLSEDYRPGVGLFVPDLYVPISPIVSGRLDDRRRGSFELRARLSPGASRDQAAAAFQAAAQRLEAAYPVENGGFGRPPLILPMSGLGSLKGRGTPSELPIVLAAPFVVFALLLLIACANVAGVLLARGASRRPEITIRLAIGASRANLIGMLLSECFVLSILATAGGLLLTIMVTPLLNYIHLPNVAALHVPPVEANINLLLYAVGVAMVTCLVCGLIPAVQATRVSLTSGLREAVVKGVSRRRLRNVLVGSQVAASALLLMTCLLFLRSLLYVATVDPGFDVHHGVTARVTLEQNRFTQPQQHLFAEQVVRRLESLPGIASVSFASLIPLGGDSVGLRAQLRERQDERGIGVSVSNVGPRYFETMGIVVRNGREFRSSDREGAPPVVIVNETFAKQAFPQGVSVGRDIKLQSEHEDPWREIVAVVADNKYTSLSEAPQPQVFLPFLQTGGRLLVQVRTIGAPQLSLPAVKNAIAELDKTLLVEVQTTAEATSIEFTLRRYATILLGAMGALGLLLAMIGLFGVLAWDVTRRTPEIGLRMALGASRRAVRTDVVRDALVLVGAGTVVGLAAAVGATLPLRGFLAGVSTADPVALGAVAGVLLSVAVLASALPAHRASGIAPSVALRREG
jgi:putative ABC transport system permease protein